MTLETTRQSRRSLRDGPGETAQRILAAAKVLLLQQGSTGMKVRTICKKAGISRATFYHYFASKEDLLGTMTDYERNRFEQVVNEKTKGCRTPRELLTAYFVSLEAFLGEANARRFFEGDPEFFIEHFKRFFPHSVNRTMEALAPAFDAWDQLGARMDRKFISELLVRFMLSDVWVPSEIEPREFFKRLEKNVQILARAIDTLPAKTPKAAMGKAKKIA